MALTHSISQWPMLMVLVCVGIANAHLVLTYPGYRGNNLRTNGSVAQANGLGMAWDPKNGSYIFPYGMQWNYPCGGMPTSRNRTKWPVSGGAVAFQPGWFTGHSQGFIYVNMGLGEIPPNMTHTVVPAFGIKGPTEEPYPGSVCLPQVPLPEDVSIKVGDKATIQVVLVAQHGASLYSCVDIEFAENRDPSIEEVTRENCFNSSDIIFQYIYATTTSGAAMPQPPRTSLLALVPILVATAFGAFM